MVLNLPKNTVPHVVVAPNHRRSGVSVPKIVGNMCFPMVLGDPQMGPDPQVEICCPRDTMGIMLTLILTKKQDLWELSCYHF